MNTVIPFPTPAKRKPSVSFEDALLDDEALDFVDTMFDDAFFGESDLAHRVRSARGAGFALSYSGMRNT